MKTVPESLSRRQALRITAVAAGGIGLGAVAARSGFGAPRMQLVEAKQVLMGSPAQLRLLTADAAGARAAIEATFARMQRLESQLSRFLPDSDLSRLNREGKLSGAAPALQRIVRKALEYRELTDGAFDITVEPMLSAQRLAAESKRALPAQALNGLLSLVDGDSIQMDRDVVRFARSGMAITLDGIAKGYIIDCGAEVLRGHGFDQILVEVGGDLVTGQRDGASWQIGVRAPRAGASLVGVTGLLDQAMATSGDYLNSFSADFSLHHILDPRTGLSPAELSSASVVAPTAMDADALSTSLLVLGATAGMDLVERLPQVEALVIAKDGKIQRSSGFSFKPA